MIRKLEWTTIWSEDLDQLLPFYRDVLGLRIVNEWPGFVMLGGSEDSANVCLGTHSEVKGKASDPYRHMVALSTDDLRGEHERLTAHGVEFIEPPTDYETMLLATLKDPEGNIIQLSQRT
jgi:predicted enzyme related to lactoylglutathione lyase